MSTLAPDTKDEQDQAYAPRESIPGYNRASDGLDDHPISSGDSSGVDPFDADAAEQAAATGGTKNDIPLSEMEKNPLTKDKNWRNLTEPGIKPGSKKGNIFTRMSRNQKWFAGIGLGGAGVGIPLLLLSVLPFKLEMMIQNVSSIASQVPEHAIEQRTQYLITRALAARLIMAANPGRLDAGLVFCEGAKIGCSLFATYTNDYFKTKLGIDLDHVDANGRTSLGGKATSWNITPDPGDLDVDGIAKKITVESHGEMRKIIHTEVWEKGNGKSFMTKYLTKRLLMKQFGVRSWRGPKAIEDKVNSTVDRVKTAKTSIKTSIYNNTTGKVAPRATVWFTCTLDPDPALCKNLRHSLSTKKVVVIKDPTTDPDYADKKDTEEYKRRLAQFNAQSSLAGDAAALTEDVAAETAVKGLVTKRILAAAGGAAAAIAMVDITMKAINSAADGGLSSIWRDMSEQTYAGFSTDIITNWEKIKAGDGDLDTLGAVVSLFDTGNTTAANGTVSAADALNDGMDNNALYQAESGQAVDTSNGLTVPCSGGPNGTKKNTRLAPGELVCSDQKVVRDYTSWFDTNPGGILLKNVAKVWSESIGVIVGYINDGIGAVIDNIPGVKQAMEAISPLAEGAVNGIVGAIFEPPLTGYEASGSDNYYAFSGGIHVTQNAMMEEGVDPDDGSAMGGGGMVLTGSQLATITSEQQSLKKASFEDKPLIARIFDTSLSGSFAQRFIARIPLSVNNVATLPFSSFSQLFSRASAADSNSAALQAFGLPLYGYAADDPALSADPNSYTSAACAASAAAREASYNREPGELVAQYHQSDPCALEKMVVGIQLNSNGVTDDPYSLKLPTEGTAVSGDKQALAKKIVAKNKIQYLGDVQPTLEAIAGGADANATPCGINLNILQMIDAITDKHSIKISDINRWCIDSTVGGKSSTLSRHYAGNGSAIDIAVIDGVVTNGRDANAIDVIRIAAPFLTSAASAANSYSQVGQVYCSGGVASGLDSALVRQIDDSCDHLHLDVPAGSDPALKYNAAGW